MIRNPSVEKPRTELSLPRLHALRAAYLLLVVGLGLMVWPRILHHEPWALMQGVVQCMLGALSALAILGLRHPVRMIPLLVFEVAWKAIWLSAVALPLLAQGRLQGGELATAYECLMAVFMVAVIPWRHVLAGIAAPGDPWRRARTAPR